MPRKRNKIHERRIKVPLNVREIVTRKYGLTRNSEYKDCEEDLIDNNRNWDKKKKIKANCAESLNMMNTMILKVKRYLEKQNHETCV